jgi:hypothetical protein
MVWALAFREAEVPDLARIDEFLDRSGHVLDGNVPVHAVLVEQVDVVGLEPLERTFDGRLDVRGLTVHARQSFHGVRVHVRVEIEAELSSDDHPITDGGEGVANEFLVPERTVSLGGVKEGDAPFYGGVQERGHFLDVLGRAVKGSHAHAA